jgi:Calcineurin-like phosphoesterase
MISVIGDVHGCYNTLKELYKRVKDKYPAIEIYCVGDLVDRGNFSCEVVDFMIENKIPFTTGNHDFMFYSFMKDPESFMGRTWLFNGAEKTMESYRNMEEKMQQHLDIIEKAPLFFNLIDCFVSHAGISEYYKEFLSSKFEDNLGDLKELLIDDVSEDFGILWTRDKLLNLGKLQVVGHTRANEVHFSEENNVIYIDTSVYTGNKLSAVIVNDNKITDILSVPTIDEDIR